MPSLPAAVGAHPSQSCVWRPRQDGHAAPLGMARVLVLPLVLLSVMVLLLSEEGGRGVPRPLPPGAACPVGPIAGRSPGLPSPPFSRPPQALPFSHLILATGSTGLFPGKFNQVSSREAAIQAYEDMVKQVSGPLAWGWGVGDGGGPRGSGGARREGNRYGDMWGGSKETPGRSHGDGELVGRDSLVGTFVSPRSLDRSTPGLMQ